MFIMANLVLVKGAGLTTLEMEAYRAGQQKSDFASCYPPAKVHADYYLHRCPVSTH